jgi:hypothetical protein
LRADESFSLRSLNPGENLASVLGPGERLAPRVITEKNPSARSGHEHPVGVKCRRTRGLAATPRADFGVLVSGVVGADHMQPRSQMPGVPGPCPAAPAPLRAATT